MTGCSSLLEPVIDDGACVYETGGSILGGRKVWALAKLPGEHYIAADDRIQDYILVTIAHDGSLPFTAMHTSVRVVCQNTLSMAHSMGSEYPIVRIKHTPGYNANIRIAHKILGLSTKASAQMATFFAEMAVRAMNTAELTSFAKFVFPSAREAQNKEADARIQGLRNNCIRVSTPTSTISIPTAGTPRGQPTTPTPTSSITILLRGRASIAPIGRGLGRAEQALARHALAAESHRLQGIA